MTRSAPGDQPNATASRSSGKMEPAAAEIKAEVGETSYHFWGAEEGRWKTGFWALYFDID